MKKVYAICLATLTMLMLTACGSPAQKQNGDASATNTPMSVQKNGQVFQQMEIKDYGFVKKDDSIYYAYIAYNPNTAFAVDYQVIRVTARDENDQILSVDEHTFGMTYPQRNAVYAGHMFDVEGTPAKIEVEAIKPDDKDIVAANQLEPADYKTPEVISATKNNKKIVGEISNPNDFDLERVSVVAVFKDAEGKIVAGEMKYLDKVSGGGKTPFEISTSGDDWVTDSFDVYIVVE